MLKLRAILLPAAAALAVAALVAGGAWWLSAVPTPRATDAGAVPGVSGPSRAVRSVDHGARDAAWPPIPSYPRADDASDDAIVIPASWSADDQRHAQEWLTAQRLTNDCLASRGGQYFYRAFWVDPTAEVDGDPAPPADWDARMQRPFAPRGQTALVCWNQALVAVGRPALGPTAFPPLPPRFEASDFADSETLDMPVGWDDAQRQAGRDEWAVELGLRDCMAARGYPTYGETPRWLLADDAARRTSEWLMSLPLAAQPAADAALRGDEASVPWEESCAGQVSTALGIDLH